MRCISNLLLTLCFISGLAVLPARVSANKSYSQDRIVVAKGDRQFAPFEFINANGEPDGFSVELFRALMKRLNIQYTLTLDDWDKVQRELNDKKIDLAIGMIYSQERAQRVKFGIPHCMISYNIICRKDNDFLNLHDLAGKEIIVQRNDRAHEYLRETDLTDKICVTDSIEDAIRLLDSGEHDAVISFDVSSFYFVRKGNYKNLRVHLTDIAPEKYSIVVNTDNEELLYLLNSAIYQMKIDGEYDRIYYKWFGVYEKTKASKVIWYVLVLLVALLFILAGGLRLLRHKVSEATTNLKLKNDEALRLVSDLQQENQRRISIEKHLVEAKERAEESDRLKSAFLANMSHEIRTPLNAIVGFSSLMCEMDDAREREAFRTIITKNNELLLQLINDVLDLSKIEAGTIVINRSYFQLSEVCEQVMTSLSVAVDPQRVKMVSEIEYDCLLNSDKARLTQVLTNFLTNAVKFTQNGLVTLRTCRVGEDRVEISVTDTGVGIEADKLESVFERFVKLNSFTQGTGLGLSICKHIVKKLDGEIGVESEFGKGSRFWIRLAVATDSPQE